jgi:phosphohistidine phosphatase
MKALILVRHAKSSWGDLTLPDFDRPLNERGKLDAPMMAQRLKSLGVVPDAFVSSPAKRARKTAQAFAEVLGAADTKIIFIESLYHASPETFSQVVAGLDNQYDTVALFSHNPGITLFAGQQDVARIDDMPTCAVFAVRSEAESWTDFAQSKKTFWFFDYPKNPGSRA